MLEWMRRGGPEIVSIHIPKTGGTSFWRVLEHIYGPKAVQRVFPREYEAEAPISVKRGIRALHGHFRYADLGQRVQVASPVKLVTWLRNPVDRVISNYHYRIEKQEMTAVGLRSYAARSTARNRMARHLEGTDLADLFFVGILEEFWADCNQLGHMMGWPEFPHFWENVSDYTRKQFSNEAREEIGALNEEDEALYRRALELRSNRTSQVG